MKHQPEQSVGDRDDKQCQYVMPHKPQINCDNAPNRFANVTDIASVVRPASPSTRADILMPARGARSAPFLHRLKPAISASRSLPARPQRSALSPASARLKRDHGSNSIDDNAIASQAYHRTASRYFVVPACHQQCSAQDALQQTGEQHPPSE